MNNQQYLAFCRSELHRVFELTKAGTSDNKLKFRVEGLLHGAVLLELCTQEEVQHIMEEEHLAVFGESISQRRQRKSSLSELKADDPDAYFDIPAIARRS